MAKQDRLTDEQRQANQRRASANLKLRGSMYQCPVSRAIQAGLHPDLIKWLARCDFDPRRLMARIEGYEVAEKWRPALLRMIHNAPHATAEELEQMESTTEAA